MGNWTKTMQPWQQLGDNVQRRGPSSAEALTLAGQDTLSTRFMIMHIYINGSCYYTSRIEITRFVTCWLCRHPMD